MEISEVRDLSQRICDNMEKVIVGKRDVITRVLAAFLAGGHLLLEDVPGTGKTMLAKSLAASFGMTFKRIQFTPDLLPSDVTGIYYFNQKTAEFEFRPGGIFSNIVLADEINRATPRTQSSLLECMEEQQATVDGVTMPVGEPFFVIATQNPVETSGTFPLPEAQLDRFMVKMPVGYPSEEQELALLERFVQEGDTMETLEPVCTREDFLKMRAACDTVHVQKDILRYVLQIAKRTRENKNIAMGVSPRGAIALVRMARAYAAVTGMEFVTPEHVKKLATVVFSHRIILEDPYMSRKTAEDYIRETLMAVEAPTEEAFRQ